MAAIPAYSIFSAASELAVTAAVFYVFWQGFAKGRLRPVLLGLVLGFEALANISYMSYRLVVPHGASPERSTGMALLVTGHGVLSLLMFLALIVYAVAAFRLDREGRNVFREEPTRMWTFVGFWSASVLSGELVFALTYLA